MVRAKRAIFVCEILRGRNNFNFSFRVPLTEAKEDEAQQR